MEIAIMVNLLYLQNIAAFSCCKNDKLGVFISLNVNKLEYGQFRPKYSMGIQKTCCSIDMVG